MSFEQDQRIPVGSEHGLELNEDDSECHRILAQVYLSRHDLAKALSHQERALQLNPNDDRSACGMGEILCYAGRAEEAIPWVRKAMRLNPYHPDAYWFHLARAHFHASEPVEARDALTHVVHPRVRDLALRIAVAVVLGESADVERGVEALRQAAPNFDVEGFVRGLPYEREADRAALLDPLREAHA